MPVVHHGTPPSRLCSALDTASHVFLRVDAVRRPLTPPYEGPFPVVHRSAKTFKILRNGKSITVSVDRLKPVTCELPSDPIPLLPAVPVPEAVAPAQPVLAPPVPVPRLDPAVWPLPTRSGRHPRPIVRLGIND